MPPKLIPLAAYLPIVAAVAGPTPDWASSTGAITCTSTCLASC